MRLSFIIFLTFQAKERRAELSKMRALISAYEQKQRRIKRIKSKK